MNKVTNILLIAFLAFLFLGIVIMGIGLVSPVTSIALLEVMTAVSVIGAFVAMSFIFIMGMKYCIIDNIPTWWADHKQALKNDKLTHWFLTKLGLRK